jgi:acyl transferase domain-containing protein
VLSSFGSSRGEVSEFGEVMTTLGQLWIAGIQVDWLAASAGQRRHRVSLPTYPFERKRYWIEAKNPDARKTDVDPYSLSNLSIGAFPPDEATDTRMSAVNSQFDEGSNVEVDHGPQCTDLEAVLAGVWREILGFEKISRDENFFDLGGDSLLSTQVTSRLRATFRMDFPSSSLFEAPTIAELASYLVAHESKPGLVVKTATILRRIENMSEEEVLQTSAHGGLI